MTAVELADTFGVTKKHASRLLREIGTEAAVVRMRAYADRRDRKARAAEAPSPDPEERAPYTRSWSEVAAEYTRRTGEPMSRQTACDLHAKAMKKIREALIELGEHE